MVLVHLKTFFASIASNKKRKSIKENIAIYI